MTFIHTLGPCTSASTPPSGPGGAVLPSKQRVDIYLNGAVLAHFKNKAGPRGYQTLINETLRESIHAESLDVIVRRAICEELRKA